MDDRENQGKKPDRVCMCACVSLVELEATPHSYLLLTFFLYNIPSPLLLLVVKTHEIVEDQHPIVPSCDLYYHP